MDRSSSPSPPLSPHRVGSRTAGSRTAGSRSRRIRSPLIERFGWDRALRLGVIDIKTEEIETPHSVAQHIRRALDTLAADKVYVNPDCGLRPLPADVARAKLRAMCGGNRGGARQSSRCDARARRDGAWRRIPTISDT
ncbi:MAG: hypothetical protein ACRDTC_19720 [Pseudonocardiaceae bacterium]